VTTDFVYDALNPVPEQSASTIMNLLAGLGVDEYFSRGDATSTAFYLTDALGSTVTLPDNSGGLPTAYNYAPLGATSLIGAPNSNPYDFTGREGDGTGIARAPGEEQEHSRTRKTWKNPQNTMR